MKCLGLVFLLLLSSCVNAPKIVKGKGAVYGVLSADIHPDIKQKILETGRSSSSYRGSRYGGINYQDNMVNYSRLTGLYVGLISTDNQPQQHHLFALEEKLSPDSLALSPNDSLHIHNNTATTQHFFITKINDEAGFQSFPALKAGENAFFTVKLEGHLALLSENNPNLKVHIFSKRNMRSKRLKSGQRYQFEQLNPGDYQLVFWYWRLGEIQQTIHINAEENLHLDKTLTVKSVMESR